MCDQFVIIPANSNVNTPSWITNISSAMQEIPYILYRGADKSLARPGRKQATATKDFDLHISYL